MKITAHVMVKNESRFLWYSVMSVIKYVDKVILWDTGSTDSTLKVIDEIVKTNAAKEKVIFKKLIIKDFHEDQIRQSMLDVTLTDWFMVVDGDEIWWNDSIEKITNVIRKDGDKFDSIVVPNYNLVGDIFHYQESKAGRYRLLNLVGHYNIRAINKNIPGLKAYGEHGVFSWIDENNIRIEARDQSRICYIDAPYLHATHLRRSDSLINDNKVFKREGKLKYEIGIPFPLDFYYPEVFFESRPESVLSPWETPNNLYKTIAIIETPIKKIRRRYFMTGVKDGY